MKIVAESYTSLHSPSILIVNTYVMIFYNKIYDQYVSTFDVRELMMALSYHAISIGKAPLGNDASTSMESN